MRTTKLLFIVIGTLLINNLLLGQQWTGLNTPDAVIHRKGKVGIGTSPQFNFHLASYFSSAEHGEVTVGQARKPPVMFGVEWKDNSSSDWFYYSVGGSRRSAGLGGILMVFNPASNLRFSTQPDMKSGAITEHMRLTGNGSLGIGIMYPGHKLHVNNTDPTSGGVARFSNNAGTYLDIGVSGEQTGWDVGNNKPYIWTNQNDLIIVPGNGNVGINTTTPRHKFDVNGVIQSKALMIDGGNITTPTIEITGGGDFAEPFDIIPSEIIKPGMVVVIDQEHPGKLRIADKAYDRLVAGCISGANGINPGITMRQYGTKASGSSLVALSGRVYCLADASFGAIQPGDMLTTSNTAGHAMKASDYTRAQGAILGKALTSLNDGQGLVMILVTLQ